MKCHQSLIYITEWGDCIRSYSCRQK